MQTIYPPDLFLRQSSTAPVFLCEAIFSNESANQLKIAVNMERMLIIPTVLLLDTQIQKERTNVPVFMLIG